jgi:hypothetical protein
MPRGKEEEMTSADQFFASQQFTPPTLLRRSGGVIDEAFINGQWRPSKSIIDFMFGHDDYVDPISESQARDLAPAAFA